MLTSGEDNHSVVQLSTLLQLVDDYTDGRIHLTGHSIVILHHTLMFVMCVEPPSPSIPSLVLLGKEVGHLVIRVLWFRNCVVTVHRHTCSLGPVLPYVIVDSMCGIVGDVEEERFVFGLFLEKSQCVGCVLLCDMP